jgi:hypothetical protein
MSECGTNKKCDYTDEKDKIVHDSDYFTCANHNPAPQSGITLQKPVPSIMCRMVGKWRGKLLLYQKWGS